MMMMVSYDFFWFNSIHISDFIIDIDYFFLWKLNKGYILVNCSDDNQMNEKNGEEIRTHNWIKRKKKDSDVILGFYETMMMMMMIMIDNNINNVCGWLLFQRCYLRFFPPFFITPCKPSEKWNFLFSLLKSTDIGKKKDRFVKTIGNDTFIIFRWCRCLSILILSSFLFFSKLIHFDSDHFFSSVLPFALTHTKKNVSLFENR